MERNQARLATLKKVRPAFMDEYEKLEGEMKKCYEEYMVIVLTLLTLLMISMLIPMLVKMDDYERLEGEMNKCYEEYIIVDFTDDNYECYY